MPVPEPFDTTLGLREFRPGEVAQIRDDFSRAEFGGVSLPSEVERYLAWYVLTYARAGLAMAASVDIGTFISKRPDFKGGDAYVTGTGVRVKRIVSYYKLGYLPEQIAHKYGHLNLAQVHAALAYYHANRDEIDASIAEDDQASDDLERAFAAGDPSVHPFPG